MLLSPVAQGLGRHRDARAMLRSAEHADAPARRAMQDR